jgi:hypothetical protein
MEDETTDPVVTREDGTTFRPTRFAVPIGGFKLVYEPPEGPLAGDPKMPKFIRAFEDLTQPPVINDATSTEDTP